VPPAEILTQIVVIVGHAARAWELTAAQATEQALCGEPGWGSGGLIPAGVIVPSAPGFGVARACAACAPVLLAP
jgi:hypothetical protein